MDKEVIVHEDHDPSVHHEETDVNVRAILFWVVVFVISAVVLHFVVWYLFEGFRRMERKKDVAVISRVPGSEARQIPPSPHLQPFPDAPAGGEQRKAVGGGAGTELTADVPRQDPWKATPVADMDALRKHYDDELNSYGWVDRNRGIVHIPIEEAKRRLLAKGIPSREQGAAMQAPASTPSAATAAPMATPTTATAAPAATTTATTTAGAPVRQ